MWRFSRILVLAVGEKFGGGEEEKLNLCPERAARPFLASRHRGRERKGHALEKVVSNPRYPVNRSRMRQTFRATIARSGD
jgi:hypothetical protein